MLSVLIPVYSEDITNLVNTILHQLKSAETKFEIIARNDNGPAVNPTINDASFKWIKGEKNLGRAGNRNSLINTASFEWLLFLDADMEVHLESFISHYLKELNSADVLCGGFCYAKEKPPLEFNLRWNYGRSKEVISLKAKRQYPYKSFKTGNFLAHKRVFQNINFDDTLLDYGHEDTLFGKELLEAGVSIAHIDNPCVHIGLETNAIFIKKTKEGINSLFILYKKGAITRNYSSVIKWSERLMTLNLAGAFLKFTSGLDKDIKKLEKHGRPIWKFQLFKLRLFTQMLISSQTSKFHTAQ